MAWGIPGIPPPIVYLSLILLVGQIGGVGDLESQYISSEHGVREIRETESCRLVLSCVSP